MTDTPDRRDPLRPADPDAARPADAAARPAPAAADPGLDPDAPAPAGEPDPEAEWLSIKVIEDEEEARLIIGFLRANGFDARVDSRYSHEFPTHMGRLGEIEIELPAAQAAEAKRLLEEREAAPPEPEAPGEPPAGEAPPGS